MKKKLGLLAMYLVKGDSLLLDEPFNGLDIESQAICTELMRLLNQNHNTIIISSHIISQLTTTCEKIHFLKDGFIADSFEKSEFSKIELIINDSFKQTVQRVQETFGI